MPDPLTPHDADSTHVESLFPTHSFGPHTLVEVVILASGPPESRVMEVEV